MNEFSTFPLADVSTIEKDSNVTIPTDDGVEEVKDWVDFNEK
ncbi:CDIF630_02480 family spore surface protein [Clostridium aminobutyricum]|uniref:DUF3787 domain-containing protein n=1 Tax=Clostridium aminobutyricum TaxID=33953 RepID=A0A939D782_CLOAM|nr:DUF3787 domain-containing protein [Clostridium aminobutyricum]MBN7772794.1 DUF3787 domain-containing protein [Clostridium aminobutyricum]